MRFVFCALNEIYFMILKCHIRSDHDEKAHGTYLKAVKHTTLATILLGCAGLSTCTTYVLTPIIRNLYLFLTKQPMVRQHPFQVL